MTALRRTVAAFVLALTATTAAPAEAAWNNVFQVTCWNCRPRSSNYSPSYALYSPTPVYNSYSSPACDPCPQPCQPQCTTKYVQRCYYQPVQSYTTQTYYEPVTTYQTKTYYEPVTTYRYSCYYDPCSCKYQQVATPVVSYQMKCQQCPVQSWVQRCAQVPVTTYQQSFYWEPQTTCCSTTTGAPIVQQQAPIVQQQAPVVVPQQGNGGYQTQPPPQVDGKQLSDPYEKYTPQNGKANSQFRQLPPAGQVQQPVKAPVQPPPPVKLERITMADGPAVQGQVVSDKQAPKAGVQLTFVSAQKQNADKRVTADAAGRFQVELPAGQWYVYLRMADGQQVYHSQIDVASTQKSPIVLVSR